MSYTITERQPDGNVSRYWQAFASDAPGTHLIVVVDGSSGYNGYVWYADMWTQDMRVPEAP